MVLLYEHPVSPYAQKVKIALAEKGVPFETRLPDLLGGEDPAFAAANPRREVPALVDGDVAVFDSTVILEYIEDRWPTPPLLPREPAARARARMIEELCDTYYEAANWAVFEIRFFKRAEGPLADRLLARAADDVHGANAWLERQLGAAPWFDGERFGWGTSPSCRRCTPRAGRGRRPRRARASRRGSTARASAPASSPRSKPRRPRCPASR
jgi:RNA polymerase-associated protein